MSTGRLEVITGPMDAGKTEEFLRRLRRVEIANRPFIVFKPTTDTRSGQGRIRSKDGREIDAYEVPVDDPSELIRILEQEERQVGKNFEVVALDEVQFFDRGSAIVSIVMKLVGDGYRVVIAGLDMDFRSEPFGTTPDLLALADTVDKLSAVCKVCGSNAPLPQRLIDGQPAPYDSAQILVGGRESYEARCRGCYVLPGKPSD